MSDHHSIGRSASELPPPGTDALAHSRRLQALICEEMAQCGPLPFDRFMELALYAPGLGYYTAGSHKFGEAGDFVTAPELSPLFARCLARQCQEVLAELGGGDVLEFGAGSGVLAAELLLELEMLSALPVHYYILDLSPDLRERQAQTIRDRAPHLFDRVVWLDRLPEPGLRGLIIANELLDAMPVQRFRIAAEAVEEGFVCWNGGAFEPLWDVPTSAGLVEAVAALQQDRGPFEEGYMSEVNLRAGPWLEALGRIIEAGVLLLIDYGYPCREYYHPQRHTGTLMCHYRHRAHTDPLILVGLQDITAHVDFSAIAMAGRAAGFVIDGYTNQASFLIGCGLEALLTQSDSADLKAHLALMQGVKRLTLPSEMGERFKVLALTRRWKQPLRGFSVRDLSARL